jgi:hypothetical protein
MRKLVENLMKSVRTGTETFQSGGMYNVDNQVGKLNSLYKKNPMVIILSFIIIELIVLLLGKYIWNNIVVDLISIARPVKTIWQIFGLSILIKLLTN